MKKIYLFNLKKQGFCNLICCKIYTLNKAYIYTLREEKSSSAFFLSIFNFDFKTNICNLTKRNKIKSKMKEKFFFDDFNKKKEENRIYCLKNCLKNRSGK